VLKAPSHLHALPALFAVYPDARVVITHRDPLAVLGSITSLMATLLWQRSDTVRYEEIVRVNAIWTARALDRVTQMRADGTIPDDRIVDVRYLDLVADPVGTLRATYEQLGRPFPAAVQAAVVAHLAARPRGRHGAHEYSFADTGLDLAETRGRYAAYQERYGVDSEV
jgi:hypothetical protein